MNLKHENILEIIDSLTDYESMSYTQCLFIAAQQKSIAEDVKKSLFLEILGV